MSNKEKTQDPHREEWPDFDAALADNSNAHYVLRLYITGSTPASTRAIINLRKMCEENLMGRFELEVVDVSLRPQLAQGEQIIAVPTLIKQLPLPVRRFIGDMSQTERILIGLDVVKTEGS